jgi:DNA topoisomerase-3
MPPVRVLNVAEKNDAAKGIAALLAAGAPVHRREGQSKYNKVYSFEYNVNGEQVCVRLRGCLRMSVCAQMHMQMTSVSGHLSNFDFKGDARTWGRVPMIELFSLPLYKTITPNSRVRYETRAHVSVHAGNC